MHLDLIIGEIEKPELAQEGFHCAKLFLETPEVIQPWLSCWGRPLSFVASIVSPAKNSSETKRQDFVFLCSTLVCCTSKINSSIKTDCENEVLRDDIFLSRKAH